MVPESQKESRIAREFVKTSEKVREKVGKSQKSRKMHTISYKSGKMFYFIRKRKALLGTKIKYLLQAVRDVSQGN